MMVKVEQITVYMYNSTINTFTLGIVGKSEDLARGGDSYSKVGGLMRCEAWQRAIARCDLGGSGDMQNFLGVFWVSEIDSDALSVV